MKHLLVVADKPKGKNLALKRALAIQQATGAKIILMGFCYANIDKLADTELAKLSRSQLEKKMLAIRRQQLRDIIAPLNLDKTKVTIKVLWSKHIVPAINAYCDSHPVDMVIKSANRSETLLYTPTDWQLFREAPVPVLITASNSWKKKTRVLASLDLGSKKAAKLKLNHAILKQAKALSELLGEELHIAYALSVPQPLVDMDLLDAAKYARGKRKKIQPLIEQFCQEYRIEPSNVHVQQGQADKVIPSIANKLKADVVVTGTVGRKGLKGKLIGNTAEGILTRLRADIVTVK